MSRNNALLFLFCTAVLAHGALAQGPRPKSEWVFDQAQLRGQMLRPKTGVAEAELHGKLGFRDGPIWPSADFQGHPDVVLSLDYQPGSALLPQQKITVEAWVNLRTAGKWDGIIGAMQDNGGFEKGWLLGCREGHFSFALATTGSDDGDGKMTYLASKDIVSVNQWHQVVGTFDGKHQRVFVDGELAGETDAQSGKILYPDNAEFVIGAYRDSNERYAINGLLHSTAIWRKALTAAQIKRRYKAMRPPPVVRLDLLAGPVVRHRTDGSVIVKWRTTKRMLTALWLGVGNARRHRVSISGRRTEHELILVDIARDSIHTFEIEGPGTNTRSVAFEFDSTFDYRAEKANAGLSRATEAVQRRCALILSDAPRAGFVVVVGSGDGEVALELARTSSLNVVVVEPDPTRAATLRTRANNESLHGTCLTVRDGDVSGIHLPRWFANVICFGGGSDGKRPYVSPADVYRWMRPDGGTLYWESAAKSGQVWLSELAAMKGVELSPVGAGSESGVMRALRGPLQGAGSWTHQYANTEQTAASNDSLARGDMELLWYGPPGPRPMLDRGARSPAPVADNGRLFIQGNRILFGLDAFNGAVLWSSFFPGLRRVNMPRDASNMVAHGDELLVAEGPVCRRIDAGTGRVKADLMVPRKGREKRNWGFLAVSGERIFGSTTKIGAQFEGAEGEWYDGGGADGHKVASDSLFAVNKKTGRREWQYRGPSAIINSTIVITDDRIYFIESRSREALEDKRGRLSLAAMRDSHLVALRVSNGRVAWRQPLDVSSSERTLYLSASEGVLVLSMSGSAYAMRGIDAASGRALWATEFAWKRNHHGGAMQHPVITGGVIYVEMVALDLKSGVVLRRDLPERRGCGTLSGSQGAIFYRHHSHGIWDLETNKRTEYHGIRSGCWLGMIPSEGLLLLPEASSGCSCSKDPIQISMALAPTEPKGN